MVEFGLPPEAGVPRELGVDVGTAVEGPVVMNGELEGSSLMEAT